MTTKTEFMVTVRPNTEDFYHAMAELSEFPIPYELLDKARRLFQFPEKVVSLKTDSFSASETNELVVTFQPSDALLDLVAAVRAGKRQF